MQVESGTKEGIEIVCVGDLSVFEEFDSVRAREKLILDVADSVSVARCRSESSNDGDSTKVSVLSAFEVRSH